MFEHQQKNLILDKGLQYAMQNRQFARLHSYIAVGTGSVAPDVTQTALGNEIARTNQTLNLGPDFEVIVNGDGDYTIRRTRGFDYNQANDNLTEFGGSESNLVSAGVNTRELFRDANGNPIVITKTSNERLAIIYSLRIVITPAALTDYGTVEFRDNNNNLITSRLVKHLFARKATSTSIRCIDLTLFSRNVTVLTAISEGSIDPPVRFRLLETTPINTAYIADTPLVSDADPSATFTYLGFSNNQATFKVDAEIGPETNDRTIYGIIVAPAAYSGQAYFGRSYIATFVNSDGTPNPFVKNKDYRLRFTFQFTLSRGS